MKRLGLHSAIWATASTHFVVDAYGNMFAPLLPLLIPQLEPVASDRRRAGDVLSARELGLAAWLRDAGGSLAPARAADGRSDAVGARAQRHRRVEHVSMLAAHSPDRRTRGRGVSSTGRGARARGLRRSQGICDVGAHLRRLARIRAGAAGVRAGRRQAGIVVGVAGGAARPGGTQLHAAADATGGDPDASTAARAGRSCGRTRSRSACSTSSWSCERSPSNSLSVFLPVLLTRQGMGVSEASAAVSLYLFVSTVGGFLGGPRRRSIRRAAGDHVVARGVGAVSARRSADVGVDADAAGVGRRLPAAVDAAGQRDLRPADRAGQRGDGLVADDGVRVGCRIVARARSWDCSAIASD